MKTKCQVFPRLKKKKYEEMRRKREEARFMPKEKDLGASHS